MDIQMNVNSGMLLYDFMDRAFPVIGWVTYEQDKQTAVAPIVLDNGRLRTVTEAYAKFALRGVAHPEWRASVDRNSPGPGSGDTRPWGIPSAGTGA